MYLNTIKSSPGARKARVRVGRGIGCTLGKTCGRGHKGQHARAGGFHKVGFEGGQMPLQRRLPKVGFKSHKKAFVAEIGTREVAKLGSAEVTLAVLVARRLVAKDAKTVKVVLNGPVSSALTVKGLGVTAGARAEIESKGGRVEV
ncbi:MAG: 50S ribosomal protein L15 [Methylococcaceae bacterium]|nr:50S ribosomal protein L15 [Methylococcaceae bacterium]